MATWKKIIVSGSSISQLTNDSLYIHTGSSGVALSGSFSGSFQGDGSGLTGITAAGTLSSSAQIASDISGSFTSTSQSIASDIAGLVVDSGSLASRIAAQESFSSSLDAGFVTEAELVAATASLSASLATDIAALDLFSSSLSTTITTYTGSFIGAFSGDGSSLSNISVTQNATVTASFSAALTSSITHNFGSDNIIVSAYDANGYQFIPSQVFTKTSNIVELHFEEATTGRAVVARGGHIVSGSIPYENLLNVPANIVSGSGQILVVTDGTGVVSGSAQLAADISGSFTAVSASIAADIAGLDGNYATDAELAAATASLSSSLATDIATLDSTKADKTAVSGAFAASSGSFSTRVTTLEGSVGAGGLLSSSAQIADDISGSFGAASSSLASRITSNDTDIAGLNTYTSSLKTAITVSGQNVTVAGNLEVSGTTTTVDSTTVQFADNIIALNGTGAANGGIEVNDANGPASGSLLWDGANNYWKAGAQGSEGKVFTKAGNDGLLSGSAQIATNISGSFTSTSSSIASDIASLDSTKADKTAVSGAFTSTSSSIASDVAGLVVDSGSFSTRVTSIESSVGAGGLLSSSAQIAGDISGSFTSTSSSIASDIASLDSTKADKTAVSGAFSSTSSSLATRIAAQESFSASLDATFATDAELSAVSGALASSIAGVSAGALTSGSFTIGITDPTTGSLNFPNGGKVGDIYGLADGTIDVFVPSGYVQLNHNNTDFIYLDGTDAGIQIQGLYGTKNWVFSETGLSLMAGEVRVPQGSVFSGSFKSTDGEMLSGSAQIASNISGSFTSTSSSIASDIAGLVVDSGSFSTRVTANETALANLDSTYATDAELSAVSGALATDIATNVASINTLNGKTLVSASVLSVVQQGEVRLTTNGVAGSTIDLGLQTTDTPTFAGLTVNGDLVVTGNTVEAQVTNLNIEDKYILLNSGSISGDSGIVFGGADGVANSGVGLFWDSSYNTNDGRLGIVNSIAAGATGDQTPSYHIAGVFEGTEANAATAQADHVGNIRVENNEIFIYV